MGPSERNNVINRETFINTGSHGPSLARHELSGHLDDEYLTFENQGTEPVALTGWTVTDEAGASYQFPTGFMLQPGEQVTLYTGAGSNTATNLYWGFHRPVWNNGGDTIFVTDESGSLVLEQSYD